MFTQCPQCDKTFKVTGEQLKQASGRVRCGSCNHVFNALESFEGAVSIDSTAETDVAEKLNEDLIEQLTSGSDDSGLSDSPAWLMGNTVSSSSEADDDEIHKTYDDDAIGADTDTDVDILFDDADEPADDAGEEADQESDERFTDSFADESADDDDDGGIIFIEEDEPEEHQPAEEPAEDTQPQVYSDTLPPAIPDDDYDDEGEDEYDDEGDTEEEPDERREPYIPRYEDEPEEPEEHLATDVFEADLINSLEGINEEVARSTGEFDVDELLPPDANDTGADAGEPAEEHDDEAVDELADDESESFDSDETDEPDDSHEPEDEPAIDEDCGEEPSEEIDDSLEFDVPKQQWGNFFGSGYDGPIIDPVGPLDHQSAGHSDDNPDGDEETDDKWDQQDTEHDEVAGHGATTVVADADDTEHSGDPAQDDMDTIVNEEGEAESAETETSDAEDDQAGEDNDGDKLRTAIDTLTMEEDQWRRMMYETNDDITPPFIIRTGDDEDAQEEDDGIGDSATPERPDFEAHDFDDASSDDDGPDYDGSDYDGSDAEPADFDSAAADDADSGVAAEHTREHAEEDVEEDHDPVWISSHEEEIEQSGSGSKRWLVAAALILLGLGLAAQLIHHNRETLAVHPEYGSQIRNIYALVDRPLYPAWDLSAYEIRGSEAISGESGSGILDIRAQLAITSAAPMGEPLIKVILKDRWGKEVSSRIFTPDEYSKGMRPPNGLLPGGSVVPVHLSITDPGTGAQGFEVDVCVSQESGTPVCRR